MMQVDIYDFDKTVVPFDSGSKFTLYCLLHYPWCIVYLPIVFVASVFLFLKVIDLNKFKKVCFIFYSLVPKKQAVKNFWDKYESSIYPWFKKENRKRFTVVISASPDFLLEEIAKRKGVEIDCLLCSKFSKNGVLVGNNCKGKEKVSRFYNAFDKKKTQVVDVYSDSMLHDKPIFSLGQNCYQIVNGARIKFDFKKAYANEK